jgi:hypothetical protein
MQEVDHQNIGGFSSIFEEFVQKHALPHITQHVVSADGARDVLSEPLASEFVELHRACTAI